jgi:hypothetical protein
MDSVNGVCSTIQVLFWTYDVDVFAIFDCLADKRYILETINREVFLLNVLAQDVYGLEVEGSLTEDGTN